MIEWVDVLWCGESKDQQSSGNEGITPQGDTNYSVELGKKAGKVYKIRMCVRNMRLIFRLKSIYAFPTNFDETINNNNNINLFFIPPIFTYNILIT